MESRQEHGSGKLPWRLAVLVAALGAPVAGQVTQRVSVSSSGAQANGGDYSKSISADGRYVAFTSDASNLVAGDTNGFPDVFVRDRLLGTTERVSVDSSGGQGNNFSGFYGGVSISADGRYVAFDSYATNLVPGDNNGVLDVFVHDRQSGTTERVSVDSSGVEGNGTSSYDAPSVSADGRYVAFSSDANNLVPGDTNGASDIFVRDRQTGITERVSVDSTGVQGNFESRSPSISADGRYVAFWSYATNLVPGDTNGWVDVFVRDRLLGTTERVSVDSSGVQGNSDSGFDPSPISADGRFVAFSSAATNLVSGDTNGHWDGFVHDRQSGITERVSVDSSGVEGNGDSGPFSISSDGRYVAFESIASNLVPGDTNGSLDVFVRDRQGGTTERVSVDSSGVQGNGDSVSPSFSADGRNVAFDSYASNLTPGDTNGQWDVFVRDSLGGPNFTSLCEPGVGGVVPCPCANPPNGSGGCNNSSFTGGAILSVSGATYLSSDSLVITTGGENPTATSVLLQGTSVVANGSVYGQGVRCVGGTLKRLFVKHAIAGSVTAPDFVAGDPSISSRSAALGDVIQSGQSRWYLVYYRDPTVLGGCPTSSTFNATQTGQVTWSP